ncbi:MAG: hypothetical protein GWP15_00300 [Nitrospirae bacterium]|nr:hypothetical protein [Nitrospirota bacterium]
MSNFLSPSERPKKDPRYPENLFLDSTKEALEESGCVVVTAEKKDDSEVLHVSFPNDAAIIVVKTTPDGRLYVSSEIMLRVLQDKLGI